MPSSLPQQSHSDILFNRISDIPVPCWHQQSCVAVTVQAGDDGTESVMLSPSHCPDLQPGRHLPEALDPGVCRQAEKSRSPKWDHQKRQPVGQAVL